MFFFCIYQSHKGKKYTLQSILEPTKYFIYLVGIRIDRKIRNNRVSQFKKLITFIQIEELKKVKNINIICGYPNPSDIK